MNKTFNRIAAAGALLLLNGAVAFAQSNMKVDVPFAFHTATAQMPAGRYYLTTLDSGPSVGVIRLQHAETGKSVLAVAGSSVIRPNKFTGLPALVAFKCAAGNCALAEVFGAGSVIGRNFPVKIKAIQQASQVAVVRIPAASE